MTSKEMKIITQDIEKDTELLRQSMEIINEIVKEQGESLDLIEDEINHSYQHINSSVIELDASYTSYTSYSTYLYPTISFIATIIYFLL